LRTTQFSVPVKLKQLGPTTINELVTALVMDRTTLGRNILPLEREGLIAIMPRGTDRRSKKVQLTSAGGERLRASRKA
jgi:DNA-binding MarR family transcriptional regulator